MEYKKMTASDLDEVVQMYIESFNAPPWNDKWTEATAGKRLRQIVNSEDFYGICAYAEKELCAAILGNREQFFDGIRFQIKEFCVRNSLRGRGLGAEVFDEFEQRLKAQGIGEIILLTSKHEATEGFYLRRGLHSYDDMLLMGKRLQREP